MPTPTKGPRLGGSPAHERLMLANLATSLFQHGKITTTETKAKRLRPLAEQLITKAKRGDLHARRRVLTVSGTRTWSTPCSTRSRRATPTVTVATPGSSRRARARVTPRRWRSSSWSRSCRSPTPQGDREGRRPQGRAAGRGRGARPGEDDVAAAAPADQDGRGAGRRCPATPTAAREDSDEATEDGRRPESHGRSTGPALPRGAGPVGRGGTSWTSGSGCGWTSRTTAPTSPAGPPSPAGVRWPGCSPRRWTWSSARAGATGLTVAGRTDAGVHATGQVCHLDLPADVWRRARGPRWCAGWPGCSPPDVRVRGDDRGAGRLRRPLLGDFRRYEYRVTDAPCGRRAAAPARHARLAPAARPGRAQRRRGRAGRRARLRGVLPAQGARHHGARGDPAGLAARAGRDRWSPPCRPTRSARRWCAAWSGAMLAVGRRPPAGGLAGRPADPAGTGERGDGGAAARADPGRGGLPRRPGRVRPPGRAHPPTAGARRPGRLGSEAGGPGGQARRTRVGRRTRRREVLAGGRRGGRCGGPPVQDRVAQVAARRCRRGSGGRTGRRREVLAVRPGDHAVDQVVPACVPADLGRRRFNADPSPPPPAIARKGPCPPSTIGFDLSGADGRRRRRRG